MQIRISGEGSVFYRKEMRLGEIVRGQVSELYRVRFRAPKCLRPMALKISVSLSGGDTDCENQWELYAFPKARPVSSQALMRGNVTVTADCDAASLWKMLEEGKKVVLLGAGPFASREVSWQLSVAGRTNGHLATAIADHPLLEDFPHEGYCGRQFEQMMQGACAVVMDGAPGPHRPVIDIASSYKNAHREAMLFEYCVGKGQLLVCTLHLSANDAAARWLKDRMLSYALGEEFRPRERLTKAQFDALCQTLRPQTEENSNQAMNKNDITM